MEYTFPYLNQSEEAVSLSTTSMCQRMAAKPVSPIDDFYENARHLLTLGSSTSLADEPTLGRLLILGLVSSVEAYFKAVLSSVIRICPMCAECAGTQQIQLAAIHYYGPEDIGRGLVEHASFTSAKEILARTQTLTGVNLHSSAGGSVAAALDEFERLCHIRHAAVHAQGILGLNNVTALNLPATNRYSVSVDIGGLHSAAATCYATVRAYNRELFDSITKRLWRKGKLRGLWTKDRECFSKLVDLFLSHKDQTRSINTYNVYQTSIARLRNMGMR